LMRDVSEPEFGSGQDTVVLPRRARAGVALLTPPQGRFEQVVVDVDADLNTVLVEGHEERDVAAGAEVWMLGRRIGVRGGVGTNTASGGGSFGAVGVSVAPFPGVYVEGSLRRGESGRRDRWGIDLRLAF